MARTRDPRLTADVRPFAFFPSAPVCWTGVLAVGALLLAYWPALHGGFLWDDDGHVTRADLRSFGGLFRIWFEIGATQQYYPLLHSAFWLEHRFWGDSTLGYHLANLFLHLTAAYLFGRLLIRLAVPGAWLAALLFALHPVCVESVAWISEQKNTLSAVFYLLAALAYLRWERGRPRPHLYFLATAFFLLALLTKTVTATLPAALLVIFWWQRGRLSFRRDVTPLLPWFILGAAAGLFTAHFEHELIGAQGADFALDPLQRALLAGRVFWFYLGKLAWPADLTFIYPHWTVDAASVAQWLFPLAALVLLGVLVFWTRRSRAPLATGLLFAGTLFPVLGFVNVFPFLFSYVADHFQYLASLPIFAFAAASLVQIASRLSASARRAGALALLAILATLTWRQSRMYRDVFALYETTLARNPDCWLAHNNLAMTLANLGRVPEAVPHLERALALRPDFPEALNNLGDDFVQLQKPDAAIPLLEKAIRLQPTYAVAHRNLGRALAMADRTAAAIPHFVEAARLNPADPEAELNWGLALMLTNRFDEAVPHFERACTLDATPNAHLMFGRALLAQHRYEDAATHLRAALELDDNSADTHLALGQALRALGRTREAESHFLAARQLGASQ